MILKKNWNQKEKKSRLNICTMTGLSTKNKIVLQFYITRLRRLDRKKLIRNLC
jgi:hypothetical protein